MKVELVGLPKLLGKMAPDWLYYPIAKSALDQLGRDAAGGARSAAGSFRYTGALSAGMTHKVNSVPKPLWVVVRTDAVGKTGRRYPWILEFDARYGHKNWLRNAVRRVQSSAGSIAASAGSKIAAKWRS